MKADLVTYGDVYMQTDNSYYGGVFIMLGAESYKIVKTNVTERLIRLKNVPDRSGQQLSLYNLRSSPAPVASLPQPGLYVTEYGDYDDSEGLIAVQYNVTVGGLCHDS